ncbi:MAG: hypothetical protein KDE56_24200, partial [Anaerolineales bacterium]|nr:hypothetical protein [Anaerolineales bacterium]
MTRIKADFHGFFFLSAKIRSNPRHPHIYSLAETQVKQCLCFFDLCILLPNLFYQEDTVSNGTALSVFVRVPFLKEQGTGMQLIKE